MKKVIYFKDEKDFDRMKRHMDAVDLDYSLEKDFSENKSLDGFVYVPKINLYVSKEKKFHGKNWFEAHKELQKNDEKMLTIPEFLEFLKYTKENNKDVYNEITQFRSPWRAEWLDADFKVKKGVLHMNYHVFDEKGKIIEKSEVLDKNTLMKDRTPGISLEDYLDKNHTQEGLPSTEVKKGNLFYRYPRSDGNSVAGFGVYGDRSGLDCNGYPSGRGDILGVRSAKQRE